MHPMVLLYSLSSCSRSFISLFRRSNLYLPILNAKKIETKNPIIMGITNNKLFAVILGRSRSEKSLWIINSIARSGSGEIEYSIQVFLTFLRFKAYSFFFMIKTGSEKWTLLNKDTFFSSV